MSPELEQALVASGAHVIDGQVADFGHPLAELQAAGTEGLAVPLTGLACLQFTGVDAESFLHGQLSCDVRTLHVGAASYGSYCTPQGRMLATFLLIRTVDAYLMLLPGDIAEATQKRLSMFILRSKVKLARADWVVFGIQGNAATAPLGDAALMSQPDADGGWTLRLDAHRSLLLVPASHAIARWEALRSAYRPAGSPVWEWLDIRAGIPWIGPATREEFIPQMVNLDLVGGVSFSKGCYPGQEVVARTQFRGQVKRRMYLAHVDAAARPRAGDALYSDDLGDQASGKIVAAQPAPQGGYDLLAVATVSSREQSVIRLKAPDGPALDFQPLPYAFP